MAKIIGNTTATSNPQPDWGQTDSTKSNYIKNKPDYDGSIAAILSRLDELEYVPITINSFTHSVGVVELGRIITSIPFAWSLNKTPTTLKIGNTTISTSASNYTLSIPNGIGSTTAYTLTASDSKNTATKSVSVQFCNGVYYGVAADSAVDSAFILGLDKTLQGGRNKTFPVTAGSGQYIWYAIPTRYGACTFNVGGFDGGFTLANTVSFTNSSGYTENYYVYRSDNANLGTQTIKVS